VACLRPFVIESLLLNRFYSIETRFCCMETAELLLE